MKAKMLQIWCGERYELNKVGKRVGSWLSGKATMSTRYLFCSQAEEILSGEAV